MNVTAFVDFRRPLPKIRDISAQWIQYSESRSNPFEGIEASAQPGYESEIFFNIIEIMKYSKFRSELV